MFIFNMIDLILAVALVIANQMTDSKNKARKWDLKFVDCRKEKKWNVYIKRWKLYLPSILGKSLPYFLPEKYFWVLGWKWTWKSHNICTSLFVFVAHCCNFIWPEQYVLWGHEAMFQYLLSTTILFSCEAIVGENQLWSPTSLHICSLILKQFQRQQ